MNFEKEITYRDYNIVFEFDIDDDSTGFILTGWTAYEGMEEVLISCQVESSFIESQLQKWLDNEWWNNGDNYILDRAIDKMERRFSFMEER